MDVCSILTRLLSAELVALDRAGVERVLDDVRLVAGAIEAVRLRAIARLEAIADETGNADPAGSAGVAGRTGRRQAERVRKRSAAAAAVPDMLDALSAGAISPEHLDALANALSRLEPEDRVAFLAAAPDIGTLARRICADEFARALAARELALGSRRRERRFARQRQDTSLRWWTDPTTGMVRLSGEFDPERGLLLTQRLRATAEALFRDAMPEGCPSDPQRRQDHLRALALLRLVVPEACGGAAVALTDPMASAWATSRAASPAAGPPAPSRSEATAPAGPWPGHGAVDMLVVVDLRTLVSGVHAASRVELPMDADVPIETLRRMACSAGVVPVVLDGEGVVIDLGRRRRLASIDQRRALRAMYRTCGVHATCSVPFDQCEPHHVAYWTRDRGPTDLSNLVPACATHHHMVHEGGWRLELRRHDRRLTVTFPDGTVQHCWPDTAPATTRSPQPEEVAA